MISHSLRHICVNVDLVLYRLCEEKGEVGLKSLNLRILCEFEAYFNKLHIKILLYLKTSCNVNKNTLKYVKVRVIFFVVEMSFDRKILYRLHPIDPMLDPLLV